jgi:hypothetical protein
MSYSKAISASDPQATEKLTAKLQKCEEAHETMKGVNAHWRKTGSCVGAPGITDEQAAKIDTRIASAQYPWDKTPYSDYSLKNNYAEIKRLKTRIETLARNKETGFNGWEFEGGHAEANTEINRLQLFFDGRTDKETHSALRHAGFVFSRANSAYQRQLNDNAIYAAGRLDFLAPIDGRTVREHQPHVPKRDDKAR